MIELAAPVRPRCALLVTRAAATLTAARVLLVDRACALWCRAVDQGRAARWPGSHHHLASPGPSTEPEQPAHWLATARPR